MEMPLHWHRRAALVLAGQLPENLDDAYLVMEALQDLVDNFLAKSGKEPLRAVANNVLPFNGS